MAWRSCVVEREREVVRDCFGREASLAQPNGKAPQADAALSLMQAPQSRS